MLSSELYHAGDPELTQDRLNARKLTRLFNETLETDLDHRTKLLKTLFGSTGRNLYVEPTFRCDYGYNIHTGENFYANFDCVLTFAKFGWETTVLLRPVSICTPRRTRLMQRKESQVRSTVSP